MPDCTGRVGAVASVGVVAVVVAASVPLGDEVREETLPVGTVGEADETRTEAGDRQKVRHAS